VVKLQVSVQIRRSPGEVWAAVEDVATHPRWMVDARSIRFLTDQRRGVGTAFECDTVLHPVRMVDRMEITSWVPRREMGVRHTGAVSGEGVFTLRRVHLRRRTTRFTWSERLRFPWWLGGPVGALAAKPVLTAVWRRSLRNLKRLVEDGAP
jgi:uncharacterized protein YndB with AHSA1/START domain